MDLYQIGTDIRSIREALNSIEQQTSSTGPLKLDNLEDGNLTCRGRLSTATCKMSDGEKCYEQLKKLDDKIGPIVK
jgi:hypothetical protein